MSKQITNRKARVMEQQEVILTDKEKRLLAGMVGYWTEVANRDDTSPLSFELQQVFQMLGLKVLWIIRDYLTLTERPTP